MAVINLGENSEQKEDEKKEKKRKIIHPGVAYIGSGRLRCKKCGDFFTHPHDDIIGKCKCGLWVMHYGEMRWIRYSSAPVRVAGPGEDFEMTAP